MADDETSITFIIQDDDTDIQLEMDNNDRYIQERTPTPGNSSINTSSNSRQMQKPDEVRKKRKPNLGGEGARDLMLAAANALANTNTQLEVDSDDAFGHHIAGGLKRISNVLYREQAKLEIQGILVTYLSKE